MPQEGFKRKLTAILSADVEGYSWLMGEDENASRLLAELPLSEKLSIAVLAFNNLSNDPEQEILRDGFAENIINLLAKISEIYIIARDSS